MIGRRAFAFSTAAGALLFTPLLRLNAAPPPAGPPKRFIGLVFTGGVPQSQFWPSGAGAAFTLSKSLEPLQPYKDRMIVVKGMNLPRRGHLEGVAQSLTGTEAQDLGADDRVSTNISIDQFVREELGYDKYLNVRANAGTDLQGTKTVSYTAPGQVATAFGTPSSAFDHVFLGYDPPRPSDPGVGIDAQMEVQTSLYSVIKEDARRLEAELVGTDRERLQSHIDGLVELEARVKQDIASQGDPLQPTCEVPDPPTDGGNLGIVSRKYLDIFIEAIRCDGCRIFTFLFGYSASHRMEWVDGMTTLGNGETHHLDCQHVYNGSYNATAQDYERGVAWHASEIAYLMQRLEEIPEGEGTALDNTLIYWTSDIAGNSGSHSLTNVPAVLMGGDPLVLSTGQYLDLAGSLENQNKVLTTIARAMGVDTAGYGAHANCGPLPGVLV
jgi:hypothetical protein